MSQRWGEIMGVGAELLIVLAAPFREAREAEVPPEDIPYLPSQKLEHQLSCNFNDVLRRRVLRCRNAIKKLAERAGDVAPQMDAVIESSQWHGYRLNRDRVRLVILSRPS